jgi:hypothetical protein
MITITGQIQIRFCAEQFSFLEKPGGARLTCGLQMTLLAIAPSHRNFLHIFNVGLKKNDILGQKKAIFYFLKFFF